MPYFVLGIALLVGVLLIGRWYVNAPPSTLLKAFKWTALGLVIVTVLFFLVAGPKLWALWALPALLPWFMRARAVARTAKNWSRMTGSNATGGAAPGQGSEVETKFLKMYLDHQSGEMNGEVTQGSFTGQTLRSLSLDNLLALLVEAREDEQSVQVLTAYLDRYHGDEWRERAGAQEPAGGGNGAMTADQAYEILGLQPGASNEEIKEAHHRLMNVNHPDHGGSTFLAAQINQAKDFLLGT
jgi:hypothetical protein